MNTFKTAVVLATLLGVGYGVHVVLNKPQTHDPYEPDGFGVPTFKRSQNQLTNSSDSDGNSHNAFEDVKLPVVATTVDSDPGNHQSPPVFDAGQSNLPTPDTLHPAHDSAVASQANPSPQMPEDDGSFDPAAFPAIPDSSHAANLPLGATNPPGDNVPQNQSAEFNQNPAVNAQGTLPAAGQDPLVARTPPQSGAQGLPPSVANQSAFEQIWQSAQSKLSEGKYKDALFTLSIWYSDPSLTSQQRDRLIPLLDELAGKVIYSAESILEAPHTIQPGETLAQIAANHAVTSDFLARVNGLDQNAVLTPGEQVKVVRGPFRGELSLERREITVFVGVYYAGRFNVGVGRELPASKMSLEVAEKSGARPYVDAQTGRQTPAGDPMNPYGNFWIGLRSPGAPVNPNLGVHSTGERVDASDTRGCVSVSDRDADDLQAIFSIGSRFTVIR